jgi:hypothetical protein
VKLLECGFDAEEHNSVTIVIDEAEIGFDIIYNITWRITKKMWIFDRSL